jgi:hypothetical protein
MKRSLLIAVVAVIATGAGAWLYAQAPKNPEAQRNGELVDIYPAPERPEVTTLQNRFLELSKKKALKMTERELRHEIETLERKLAEVDAWAKVNEAARLLHEVVEKSPDTGAAKTASEVIQIIEQRRRGFSAAARAAGMGGVDGVRPEAEPDIVLPQRSPKGL